MNPFAKVEERHKFLLPAVYVEFVRRGYLDAASPHYLNIHEGEWLDPASLEDPDWGFHPNHRDDLLPFAINGRNDRWCWVTSQRTRFDEPPIVLCPREETVGEFNAPCLIGWIYGMGLSCSTGIWYSPEDTRQRVRKWADVVRDFGHTEWADRMLNITARVPFEWLFGRHQIKERGFLTDQELYQAITLAFGKGYIDEPFDWSRGGNSGAI